MARLIGASALAVLAIGVSACGAGDQPIGAGATAASGPVLSGTQPLINGEEQKLGEYRGKVVLIVNTASECGFTPQFGELEDLYRERRSDGLMVLGFPADDVAGQEPRDDEGIADFCESNFGVSFPMFAKSNVVEAPVNPLFERLAAAAGPPSWNFNKYLLDRSGEVVDRYDASTAPDDSELRGRIDELLSS